MRFRNLIFKDISNIFVVRLTDEEISLDELGIKFKLLQLTIKNPSLVAQFFHVIITSSFSCFFKTLSRESGIFNTRLKSDADFKEWVLTYIRSIVRETVDLTRSQQFQSETSSSSRFPIPEDITAAEFQEALDFDSSNVAARVQMHIHSKTCTKYQKKVPRTHTRASPGPIVQSEGMATDADDSSQPQRRLPSQFYRFFFPRPLVLESMVTEEGCIRMERNHQFVNKYNPVIASAIGYNHDVNFSSPEVLATIYYMTNHAAKAQVDRGQLVLAAVVLKEA
ncbi:hypothetical protein BKA64DRAFT_714432 [Cadophora sp. MPI-SDFR-AT-0126]|nr:hypothetical protein BKA64DRAFT_714432 [Leotiomycetes sp. MPI-SDFR-AT-0126]